MLLLCNVKFLLYFWEATPDILVFEPHLILFHSKARLRISWQRCQQNETLSSHFCANPALSFPKNASFSSLSSIWRNLPGLWLCFAFFKASFSLQTQFLKTGHHLRCSSPVWPKRCAFSPPVSLRSVRTAKIERNVKNGKIRRAK